MLQKWPTRRSPKIVIESIRFRIGGLSRSLTLYACGMAYVYKFEKFLLFVLFFNHHQTDV